MNKTKIDWPYQPLYTWNPVTGCKRGCKYCYARRIYERFNKSPFNEIIFHPSRMDELEWLGLQQRSLTIFVGSMSDIEYWPYLITDNILGEIEYYRNHTFMFLSKNPLSYYGYSWPTNTMQGLTMVCDQGPHVQAAMLEQMVKYPRPFLSLEPLLGTLFENEDIYKMDKVIVGAMTGPGATVPNPHWIDAVNNNVPPNKIYWKKNIRPYLQMRGVNV